MVKSKKTIGSWAFLAGVVLAVLFGLVPSMANYMWVIVVIGLIVGLLNVSGSETMPFLMSGAVLIIAASFGGTQLDSVPYATPVFKALLTIFVPATIVVAVKNVFNLARD